MTLDDVVDILDVLEPWSLLKSELFVTDLLGDI